MATYLMICDEIERSLRKQRVFRDRTKQLDTLTDTELVARYRLPRYAILSLVDLLKPQLERPTQRSFPVSTETQVLLTLRYLGKGGFLSEIGDLHGLDKSTVSRVFHNTTAALNTALDNIQFPWDHETLVKNKSAFYKIAGFPNVIGAVDGTLIPITRPCLNEEIAYVCRKGYHAINIQAICDANLRIINVVAKWPGATHDALIFNNSQVGLKMQRTPPDGWLLGDSGYACRPWLLTPVINPSSKGEENYNYAHVKTRNCIERCFGVLKSRFRCLHKSTGCLLFTPEKCATIVMAVCKLHNFCISNNVDAPSDILELEDEPEQNFHPVTANDGQAARMNLINQRFF